MNRYAVIDFETTGLSPNGGDRAIEIGAVIVEQGRIVDSHQTFIDPGVPIPPFITSLTGITSKMVAGAPKPRHAFEEILRFVDRSCLVAHNASFDRRFWESELCQAGLGGGQPFLCTMLMSRRLYPWADNHRLETLVELHGIKSPGRHHRALADATMTAELFKTIQRDITSLYDGEVINSAFLTKYQRLPKAKAKATPPLRRAKARTAPQSTPNAKPQTIDIEVKVRHESALFSEPQKPKPKISANWLLWIAAAVVVLILLNS